MSDWSAGESSTRAQKAVDSASGGKISIKPENKGLLHENLGVPQGQPIPASKLAFKPTDTPAVKKRKVFAQNAKKWNH